MEYNKIAGFGFVYGVFTYMLAWIVGLVFKTGTSGVQATINIAPIATGVKQQIQSGIATDLSSKLIGWLSGVSPFSLMGIITVGVAGVIIALIGAFLLDIIQYAPIKKTPLRRIVFITSVGTLVSGILLGLWNKNPQLPAVGATVSMTIYFVIAAVLYLGLAKIVEKTQAKGIFIQP